MTNKRDNNTWLRDLRGQGIEHEAALADLRALLLEDLPRGLSMWLPSEHTDFVDIGNQFPISGSGELCPPHNPPENEGRHASR